MKSSVIKRSIVIGGHKTSVSLEDPFWDDLKNIAHEKRVTLSELVAQIDGARKQSNLSSAIRLFVLEHFQNENKRVDVTDAGRSLASAEDTNPALARVQSNSTCERMSALGPKQT